MPSSKTRAFVALRQALSRLRPDVQIDHNGYAPDFRATLLPFVMPYDFEDDLSAGDGNELESKFRAAHSSSGLAVNCFAPFRRQIADLVLPGFETFDELQFERKCPTGLRGGRAPNLDVLLDRPDQVVGIESKLSEYLSPHPAQFSPAYEEQIQDERRDQGYFREMRRLMQSPDGYTFLDAAQLIKHAFGLSKTFSGKCVTLLYLYWEPANPSAGTEFTLHREEIAKFAKRVAGSTPAFKAMSYPELWRSWRDAANTPAWLTQHLANLEKRYLVQI